MMKIDCLHKRTKAAIVIATLVMIFISSSCSLFKPQEPIHEERRPDQMADLVAKALTPSPAYPAPGEHVDISLEVSNRATDSVQNVEVILYAGNQQLLLTQIDIDAESTEVIKAHWMADSVGTYTLTALVDPDEKIIEREQLDNMISVDVVVAPPVPSEADFAVSSLEVVSLPERPGALLSVVQNNGQVAAQAPLVLQADNQVVAVRLVGPVEPNTSATIEILWSAQDPVGQLSAEINPRYRVSEPNPDDNVLLQDLRPSVDLRVERLSVHAAQFEQARPRQVTVSFRVVNAGKQAITTPFRTSIFPGTIDPDGIRTFYVTTSELAAGEIVYVSHTIVSALGEFDIHIVTDADHIIAEDSEANNIATSHFRNPNPDVGRWVSIGPRLITSGLGAVGRLHTIAIDPTDPLTIYVGAPPGYTSFNGGSGVWKSIDGGTSWWPIADALPTLTITALAIDPSAHLRIYSLTPLGVFRSEDAGTSWAQISGSLNIDRSKEVLLIHPANSDTIYFTSKDGVYRSRDRGASWSSLNVTGSGGSATDLVMSQSDPNRLYAAMRHPTDVNYTGIYETVDGGDNWLKLTGCPGGGSLPPITDPDADPNIRRAGTTIRLALSGSQLYASYKVDIKYMDDTTESSWTFYRTTEISCWIGGDYESYWEAGWNPPSNIAKTLWKDIYADPVDSRFVYATGTHFWVSDNYGEHFHRADGPHVDHHGFATDPVSPEIIYTACDGGIYRSTDRGDDWQFIGEGILNVEFYDIANAATEPNLVIGGTQDNGTVKYDGSSTIWEHILGGDGATVDIDPTNAQIFYAGGQNIGIRRSTDGGDSFDDSDDPFRKKQEGDPDCFNPHFHVHPSIPSKVLESCQSCCSPTGDPIGGLWTGAPWVTIFTPGTGKVKRSTVDPTANLYYAGSSTGGLYAGPAGADWRMVYQHDRVVGVTDIEIDLENPEIVYVSFEGQNDGRVFRLARTSAEPYVMAGVDITSDLPDGLVIRALAVDRMAPFTIYAGTNQGVYRARSTDGGTTWLWTHYNNGLPLAVEISELEVHPTTGVMRASTFGRSAYEVNTDFPIGAIIAAEGKVTMLRVHDEGTGYGPSTDFIDVEVVIWLDSQPGKAFGFQLRDDENENARRRMLDLLRDAFNNKNRIRIEYIRTGFRNGIIIRVMEIP